MTVTSTKATVSYLGNGQTTAFDFDFLVPSGALLVSVDGEQVTTGFTASGLDRTSGGTVVFASPPASGVSITISRTVSLTQERAFVNGQAIYAKEIEGALDKLTMALQNAQDGVDRAVKVPVGSSENADTLVSSLIGASVQAVEGAASAALAQTAAEAAAALAEAAAARISSVLDYIPASLHAGIGDGTNTTDLTAYIQAALDAGEGHFPPGAYNISQGLVNSAAIINMEAGARIRPQGAGYTALTINGQFAYTKGWKITVHNDWNPFDGNGVWWTNPAACEIDSIKVYAVSGFGVKLEQMYDCTVNSLSTVLCGSAGSEYAFQVLDGADTTNQSVFSHIQVELSGPKAIYISTNTRHCVFTQIHSERTYAAGNTVCHFLGGAWCTYQNVRIANHGDVGNAGVVVVQAAETAFHQLYMETDTQCEIAGYSGNAVSFYDSHFTGAVYATNNQTGTFHFERCAFFKDIRPDTSLGYVFHDCDITSLVLSYINHAPTGDYIADVRSNALRRRLDACRIESLTSNSTAAAACFTSCVIEYANCAPYYQIYDNCTVKGGLIAGTGFLEIRNSRVVANIVFWTNSQGWVRDSVLVGDILTDGSAQQNCAYINVALSGTAGAGTIGPPTYGTWVNGERCDRLVPEVGQPTGWIYISGSGWTALANL